MATYQLQVFYDGLCVVCSKEIEHYQKQKGSENIEFIDIMKAAFKADSYGIDRDEVHRVMHVKKADGTFATRVDAFIEIWKVLPRYQILARLAQQNMFKIFLNQGYKLFAFARPYLPRKKSEECADDYCATGKT
jgi:predicted DCC family thiol-disulfide oxidoreductase YuxK